MQTQFRSRKAVELQTRINIRTLIQQQPIDFRFIYNKYYLLTLLSNMSIIKQEKQRFFVCSCSKSYKSYAALYTHIKNKHEKSQQYFKNIKKPYWSQNTKGRPKKFPLKPLSQQNQQLQIIEIANLQILEILADLQQKKLILENHQNSQPIQLQKHYEQVALQYGYKGFNIFSSPTDNSTLKKILNFTSSFIKHFSYEIAARIQLTINMMYDQGEFQQSNFHQSKQSSLVFPTLWFGLNGIDKIIVRAFHDWAQFSEDK